jgi:tetratricopeptide (TPR) repeat protein
MTFKPAQCPTCGGSLQLPDDRPTVNCMYCSSTIVVREAIQAAAAASVPNLLKLARTDSESLNHKEAYEYFSRVLELDGDNGDAWAGKAEAAGWLSRPQEMIKCFSNTIDVATDEKREQTKQSAGAVIARVTTHCFYATQARLSPSFAQDESWNLYLSELDTTLKALENANRLIPNHKHILEAILYFCDSHHDKVSFEYLVSGHKYRRALPPEWKHRISDIKQTYSARLYALDPSTVPAPVNESAKGTLTPQQWAMIAAGILVVVVVFFIALVAAVATGTR